jgi:hypothetical protein
MLRKIFANSAKRSLLHRSFASTEEVWIQNYRRVLDQSLQMKDKIPYVKSLITNELSYGKYFPSLKELIDQLMQTQFVMLPEVHKDKDLLDGFKRFQEKCLEQSNGHTLSTALALTFFTKDPAENKKEVSMILKKFESFISTAKLAVLARNIELLATFKSNADAYGQSSVSQKIYELINKIYADYTDTLSFESQLRLMDVFTEETKNPQNEKSRELVKNIALNLREASFPELMYISFHLTSRHNNLFFEVREQLEKATMHMLSYVSSTRDLVYLFTSVALYASDEFWEKAIPMIANTLEIIEPSAKAEVMYLCAICRRGSDELWGKFFHNTTQDISSLENTAKLKVFLANKHIKFENVPASVEKLIDEIFTPDFISKLSFPDLIILVENCFVFEDIPEPKRELAISHARKLASKSDPNVKQILENLFRNYKRQL